MRILVIDDDLNVAAALKDSLHSQGFDVDVAHTGADGEARAESEPYDVILLDVMLPDRSGVEVCRNLRDLGVSARILMLTALGSTEERVTGLDSGADDYLVKPFEFDELLARIRALMRRGEGAESRYVRFQDLELDLYSRIATRAGRRIVLSNKEFALLAFLMRNSQRVVSRTQISESVWSKGHESTSNLVDVYVSALRRKIDREFGSELIHTVKGAGYRLGPEPSTADAPPRLCRSETR